MKIQTKIDVNELAKELEKAEVPLTDWFEDYDKINNITDELGLMACLDWVTSSSEGYVEASYYSFKLGYRIALDSDALTSFKDYTEFAHALLRYHNEARWIESRLPKLNRNALSRFLEKADMPQ